MAVFRKVKDEEIENKLMNMANFQSDESENNFDVKYLKYEVEVNHSVKYGTSYILLYLCALINHWN